MLRRLLLLILLLSFRHRGCGNGCSRIWRAVRKGHTRFVSASGWAVGRETEAFAMPLPAGCGSAAASSYPGPRSLCRAPGGFAPPRVAPLRSLTWKSTSAALPGGTGRTSGLWRHASGPSHPEAATSGPPVTMATAAVTTRRSLTSSPKSLPRLRFLLSRPRSHSWPVGRLPLGILRRQSVRRGRPAPRRLRS